MLHIGVKLLFWKEIAFLILIHPRSDLAMPHQSVAAELDPVLAAEIGDPVGIFPVELTLLWLRRLGLHGVLGCDAVEFTFDHGYLVSVGHVFDVDRRADHKVVLIGVFKAVSWSGDIPGAPLGMGRDGPEHQGAHSYE